MRGKLPPAFASLAAAFLVLAVSPAAGAATHPVQDPVPIEPNQYFTGLVNGHPPGAATIDVVCPAGSTTGHPVADQPVEVELAASAGTTDTGYTGSAGKSINATLTPGTTTALIASFTSYYVPKNIPTTIVVPCSGSGTVTFAPAPTSSTAKSAVLPVTFVSPTG